ncbi:Conserved_hypothetical protein [Hexamita inflata]|uniref:Uncharacterized protein n=1 Tax=Hexamita inflata TaxID=28002 RepID=A0ABP1J9Y5_9EUKA
MSKQGVRSSRFFDLINAELNLPEKTITAAYECLFNTCFYYQYMDFPLPPSRETDPFYKSSPRFSVQDTYGEQMYWKLCRLFSLPPFEDSSLNQLLYSIQYMSRLISDVLPFKFQAYSLDQKALILLIYQLTGTRPYRSIIDPYTSYEEHIRVFQQLICDSFQQLILIPFEFVGEPSSPTPLFLDETLSQILNQQYIHGPIPFLISILRSTKQSTLQEAIQQMKAAPSGIRTQVLVHSRHRFDFQTQQLHLSVNASIQKSFTSSKQKLSKIQKFNQNIEQTVKDYKNTLNMSKNDREDYQLVKVDGRAPILMKSRGSLNQTSQITKDSIKQSGMKEQTNENTIELKREDLEQKRTVSEIMKEIIKIMKIKEQLKMKEREINMKMEEMKLKTQIVKIKAQKIK